MRLYPVAILLGVITDFVLSAVLGVVLALMLGAESLSFQAASLLFGLMSVVVGGYVTSIKSKSSQFTNVAVFGLIQIVITYALSNYAAVPYWFSLATYLLLIPFALVGYYIDRRTR